MLTATACAKYKVDRNRIDAMFFEESSFRNQKTYEVKICKYSYGPGQILLSTAREMGFKGRESELENIIVSIPLAVKFIGHLEKAYYGNWQKVLSHYRTGKSRYKDYFVRHNKIYQEFKNKNHGA
jgi:soluble lytic murein transglycosylase-like protein